MSPAQGVPAGCGNNGTSFEDDLTLGAEGTGHPWVSPPAMSLSPHDQRQGEGDAATIPHFGGMSPGSASPLWQQGRTSVSTPPVSLLSPLCSLFPALLLLGSHEVTGR